MVELSLRLIVAGALIFVSGLAGQPTFTTAVQVSMTMAIVGVIAYLLEKKNLRTPAIAGLIASADATCIASILGGIAKFPALEGFGALTLAPLLYATYRYRSQGLLMAPVAASAIMVIDSAKHSWALPPNIILAQAGTVLVVGMLLRPTAIQTFTQPIIVGENGAISETDEALTNKFEILAANEQYLELRESYRQLRDAYRDLDRKAHKDRVTAQLAEVKGVGHGILRKMLDRLAVISGAQGLVLYTTAQYADAMVVRATSGNVTESQQTTALEVSTRQAIALIRDQADRITHELSDGRLSSNLVIQSEGKVVGLLCITCEAEDGLLSALESANLSLPMIANAIAEENRRENIERRLKETEILYGVIAMSDGAQSTADIAARVVKDLHDVLECDHVGIFTIQGRDISSLATEGRMVRLLENMRFEYGVGVGGWMQSGTPEIAIADVRVDNQFPADVSLKARIGSYCVLPLMMGEELFGFLSAASARVGGLDLGHVECLRVTAAELSRLLTRKASTTDQSEGVLTPRQFSDSIAARTGYLVTLEPMRIGDIEGKYGKPATVHAMRQIAHRIRAKLPQGAFICLHPNHLLMVFMETKDGAYAVSWANDMASLSPSISIRTPDGSTPIPVNLRAKVAQFSPQNNQIFAAA